MSRETKDQLAEEVILAAREEEAANDAFDEVAAQKLGVNRTDLRCLNILEYLGPITAGQLAEESGLTTAAVTGVLDRLEARGYARRVRGEKDRRQVTVELTPALLDRATRIWTPVGKDAADALKRMSIDELKLVANHYRTFRDIHQRHLERVQDLELG
jgi:DNA-binding MarR family transcriptional regulator